ncbi:hypothetical protein SprV_0802618500 [Sparganum proliferum]
MWPCLQPRRRAQVTFTHQQEETSNGIADNVVTSTGTCISVVSHLPEKLTGIDVDSRHIFCSEGLGKARGDDYLTFHYQQERDGIYYRTELKICRYDDIFRMGLEVEGFHVAGRITQITQFLVPNGDWSINRISCILPQYSTPLIRNVTEGSKVEIQCAISKRICPYSENVVIFDLDTVFCEYSRNKRTCERREVNDTVIFATNISNAGANKYYPDHYVFCNSLQSYLSIRLHWNPDLPLTTTEKLPAKETVDPDSVLSVNMKVTDEKAVDHTTMLISVEKEVTDNEAEDLENDQCSCPANSMERVSCGSTIRIGDSCGCQRYVQVADGNTTSRASFLFASVRQTS